MSLPREGLLIKEGGGTSLFGSRSWRERFFVVKDGKLAYWKSKASYDKGDKPCKNRYLDLSMYSLTPDEDSQGGTFMFRLKPTASGAARKELRVKAASDRVRSRWLRSLADHGASDPASLAPARSKEEDEEANGAAASGGGTMDVEEEDLEVEAPQKEEEVVEETPQKEEDFEVEAPQKEEEVVEETPQKEEESLAPPPPPPPAPEAEVEAVPEKEEEEEELARRDSMESWVEEPVPAAEEPDAVICDPKDAEEDDSVFRELTEENLTRLFQWMDLNEDGSIQVIEFTNAASGRSWKDVAKAVGYELRKGDRAHRISGAVFRIGDFSKMDLFQKVDADGNTLISQEEFVNFFKTYKDPRFQDFMQDILCQLNDIEKGRFPKRRGFRTKGSREESDDET